MAKDYHKILGVSSMAGEREIRNAYHRLAKRFHPDQNVGNPKAEQMFKEVNEAYRALQRLHESYFRVLGVQKGAQKGEIKSAYEQLTKELYNDPDRFKNGGEQRLQEIKKAYVVLMEDFDAAGGDW